MQEDSENARSLTFGEKAVGLTFNPSNDQTVHNIKQAAAIFIDILNDLRASTEDGEVKRMTAVSITEAQTAQMWAVKAATWTR
jgi:hypothetical protein